MKLPIILLFGVCCLHWTAVAEFKHGDLLLNLNKRILKSVIPTTNSSDINLSGLQIVYVAEDALINLTNVKSLDLSNNKLRSAPRLSKYPQLHNLEELSLANNQLTLLSGTFDQLRNLKLVDISNNLLTSIMEEELSGLTNSTDIIIEGNPIRWISPRAFVERPSSSSSAVRVRRAAPILPLENHLKNPLPKEPTPTNYGTAKICLYRGSVTSVEELQKNEPLVNCNEARLNQRFRVLDFSQLKIYKFQRGWYKLPVDVINKIDFSNNKISHITPELLNDLPSGVSSVRLNRNSIQMIKKDVIINRYLEALFLDFNNISMIEVGAFNKTNLTILSAVHNNLKDLAFVRTLPANFKALDLSFNEIEVIPVDIFRNVDQLRIIKLMHNQVKRIESGTFLNQKNLGILDLANNGISELNSGQFKGLTDVTIDLGRNQIKKIPRGVFSEIGVLNKISAYFTGNNIDFIEKGSFSDLNIAILDLSRNNITKEAIEEGAFENSTFFNLILNRNSITEINSEWFKGISKIQNLELARNGIKNIRQGTAKYMKDLDSLDLSWNPIEVLQNGALYGLSKKKDVYVYIEGAIKIIQGGSFNAV